MSAASCLQSEDLFLCSICQDVFTDPVYTPCGHNFCRTCITQHWNVHARCVCPLCKEVFYTRRELKVNTFISEMAAEFRQAAKTKASSGSEQPAAKPGEVQCDVSTGTKVKAELGKTEAIIQQKSQQRRLKIQMIKQSAKFSSEAADESKADGVKIFTAMKQCLGKSQDDFIKTMEEKQKSTEKQAANFIIELQHEISELMEKAAEVEKLSRSEDHLHLLQSFPSISTAPPTRDWTQTKIHQWSHKMCATKAVAEANNTLRKEVQKVELKKRQQYAVDVTLDPDTAQLNLSLSRDGKQLWYADVRMDLPDDPQRFDLSPFVLGNESFSSGRFYYEVKVGYTKGWQLGVTRESSERKGNITPSRQEGYWTAAFTNEDHNVMTGDDPPVHLRSRISSSKLGVFVDYEEGLVSFYDVHDAELVLSFTGCSFTDKLLPFFCPGRYEDTMFNPLIITDVDPAE